MSLVSNPFVENAGAKRYNQYRPMYHHLPFQQLSESLNAPIGRALDVACGTGHSTQALAEISSSVIGCDLSTAMLEEARIHSRLEFLQAPAEELPFPDRTFDYVNLSMAFQWLNQKAFLRQALRVLKPDGFLGIDNYGCYGDAIAAPQFRDQYRSFDREHFPAAPRNPDFPSDELLSETGLQFVRDFSYEQWVEMEAEPFANYLMTRSNFLILPDEKKVEMQKLLSEYYERLFEGKTLSIRFAGKLRLYQPLKD